MNHSSTRLWIASGNAAKAKELVDFSARFFPEYREIVAREPKDVIENESTFEGNAKLKARVLAGELIVEGHGEFSVLADDSGLCVDLLNGRPGIFSGRYSGAGSNSKDNLEKVLAELGAITMDIQQRTGSYHCALALIQVVNGKIIKNLDSRGERRGLIGTTPKGGNGYAYDTVFLDPQTLRSYGEISYEEKQLDSHRKRAFENMKFNLEKSL